MWKHIRAALILVHLFAITLAGIPTPEGFMNERAFAAKEVQSAIRGWGDVLRTVGVSISNQQLEANLWVAGKQAVSLRRKMIRPFQQYYQNTGTKQRWMMFGRVSRRTGRLEIHLFNAHDNWLPLYVELTPHQWRGSVLNHSRMRGFRALFGRGMGRAHYQGFADWITRIVAEDFPTAKKVRVQYRVYNVGTPKTIIGTNGLQEVRVRWVEERNIEKRR